MNSRLKIGGFILLGMGFIFLFFGVNSINDEASAARQNYNWVKASSPGSCDTICRNAGQNPVYAGFDGVFNTQMYVCGVDTQTFKKGRERSSGFVPGKNVVATGRCNVPFKGREFTERNFSCLCF